jgi:hypothetical protein
MHTGRLLLVERDEWAVQIEQLLTSSGASASEDAGREAA